MTYCLYVLQQHAVRRHLITKQVGYHPLFGQPRIHIGAGVGASHLLDSCLYC